MGIYIKEAGNTKTKKNKGPIDKKGEGPTPVLVIGSLNACPPLFPSAPFSLSLSLGQHHLLKACRILSWLV